MTTTPESKTAEQIVASALRDDTRLCHPEGSPVPWEAVAAHVVTNLRAAGLLGGDPTEEQIEQAVVSATGWDSSNDLIKSAVDHLTRPRTREGDEFTRILVVRLSDGLRAALAAAGVAPQEPSECDECHRAEGHKMDCSKRVAPQEPSYRERMARAVEDLDSVRREFAPSEPSENLTNAQILDRIADQKREAAGMPAPEETSEDDRAMQIARELARMHTFTTVDALSIANAALALAAAPVVDEAKLAEAVAAALNDMWPGATYDGSPWVPDGSEVLTIVERVHAALRGGGR